MTNTPLDKTIKIILERRYEKAEITAAIPKCEMKELLYLYTKNVHFSFNKDIQYIYREREREKEYIQNDGIAMASPLGQVLAHTFMAELKKTIIISLREKIKLWKSYVDNTIPFVKTDIIKNVLSSLNSYHGNIKFTMEIEQNNEIPLLDVLFIDNLERIVQPFIVK